MTHATDIVGYVYSADIYCPDCIVAVLIGGFGGWNAEADLDRIARRRGIDRYDESSYDSGEFPKVVFASQEEGEHCGGCHEPLLGHDCPGECYGTDG